MDIIVTTPLTEMKNAAQEAADCLAAGGGYYFRRLGTRPDKLEVGDRLWYTEAGYVRGFAEISAIKLVPFGQHMKCATTGNIFGPGFYVLMRADSWKWVKPDPYPGFRGWHYFESAGQLIVGDWKTKRPEVGKA